MAPYKTHRKNPQVLRVKITDIIFLYKHVKGNYEEDFQDVNASR